MAIEHINSFHAFGAGCSKAATVIEALVGKQND